MRWFLASVAIFLSSPAWADTPQQPVVGALTVEQIAAARERLRELTAPSEIRFDAACCKVCSKGKACGDSCINRNYRCRKGVGCACDG